jgi:hypothetical protein
VGTSEQQSSAPLAMSEATMRLRMVVEEHEKLLTLVARRRNELKRVEQEIRVAVTRVAGHMEPLAEEAQRLDEAIHRMLEVLASAKQRPRRERNQIRRLHRDLQRMGVISPRETAAEDAPDFGEPTEDNGRCTCRDDQAGAGAPDIVAVKETEQGALRDLFRRLADALHPDKVQDEQDKAIRTEIMKEITVAYRERDFARLVQIERTWAASAPVGEDDRGDEVERRIALLVNTNLELRKQMRGLERELRRLRNSQHGQLSRDLKRSDRAGGGVAGVVGPVEEELQELKRVHDHVQAFQDGKIGLAEFLEGPADQEDVDESVIFGEMLGELVTLMHEEVTPRRGGRGARGQKARPKQKRRRA